MKAKSVRRSLVGWAIAAALILAPLVVVGANMIGRYSGLTVDRESPVAVLARLGPHFEVTRPDWPGPYPTALLFSGCDGPSSNIAAWAAAMAERGWATIMIDSHTPRGLHEPQLWPLVCAGQVMTGAERAGDVAVALAHARALSFVDAERIALIGASHGGWAILEFLSMADHGEVPITLTDWPIGMHAPATEGVRGAVLLYPYCGELNRASWLGWESEIPMLFLLAEGDLVADEEDCLDVIEREVARGLPLEAEVFAGVTHAFDHVSSLEFSLNTYDAEASARAFEMMGSFLDRSLRFTPAAQ